MIFKNSEILLHCFCVKIGSINCDRLDVWQIDNYKKPYSHYNLTYEPYTFNDVLQGTNA